MLDIWGFIIKCLVFGLGCIVLKIGRIGYRIEESKENLNLLVFMFLFVIIINYYVFRE